MYDEYSEPTERLIQDWNEHNDHADDAPIDPPELCCRGLRDHEAGTRPAECGSTVAHPFHYYEVTQ